MRVSMNKQRASGRKDGYACISGLADICERPHYKQCIASQSIIATQGRQGGRGVAGCECVERCVSAGRAKQRVVYSYKILNSEQAAAKTVIRGRKYQKNTLRDGTCQKPSRRGLKGSMKIKTCMCRK